MFYIAILIRFLEAHVACILVDNLHYLGAVTVEDNDRDSKREVLHVDDLLGKELLNVISHYPLPNLWFPARFRLLIVDGGEVHIFQSPAITGNEVEVLVLQHHGVLFHEFRKLVRNLVVFPVINDGISLSVNIDGRGELFFPVTVDI